MSITRAQQVRQMLEDGGMLVKPSTDGKRPGYSNPNEDRAREEAANRRERNAVANYQRSQTFDVSKPKQSTFRSEVEDETTPEDRRDVLLGEEKYPGTTEMGDVDEKPIVIPKESRRKKPTFIESINEKKRKKNQEYLQNLRNKKFEGIAAAYGLSSEQMQELLDAYNEGEDEFDLSTFRSIVDAGAPPSIIRSDPNFLKAQELALSKGMAKGNKLSTGALFSTEDPTTRVDIPGILGKVQGPETFSNVLSGLNRIQTLDEIINKPGGVKQSDIDNYFNLTMGKGGTDPVTGDTVDALFTPRDDDDPVDPCKGPNPPAYCFIGGNAPTTPDPDPVFTPSFRFMNRGGMVEDAPMGGIMDLETTRQMLFLGGVAKSISKGLKSVTRGIKKVAKSPIGKAALLGAVGFGIPGTSFGGLFGRASFGKPALGAFGKFGIGPTLFANPTITQMKLQGLEKGFFPKLLGNMSGLKVAGLSGLGGALLASLENKDEDDFDIEEYYRMAGIDIPENQYRFLAEGGSTEKEPVAKKTMPLLDMDGQEMDFRQEGGFVPIGRMEKADDVPARLSKNEFVFTADAVRNAGGGDVDKGAEVMYNTMKNLEAGGEVSEETQGLEGAKQMFQTSQRLGEVV